MARYLLILRTRLFLASETYHKYLAKRKDNGAFDDTEKLMPVDGLGIVMIILAIINEFFTSKEPILPPRLFKTRTTTALLISVFLHAITFFAAGYYVPLYFQILGSSATGAGVRQLPLSLGSSLCAVVAGFVVAKTGRYRPAMWVGWVAMNLGYVSTIHCFSCNHHLLIDRDS